jgi:hypothetical protein
MNVFVRSIASNFQHNFSRPIKTYVRSPIGKITVVNTLLFVSGLTLR